MWRKLCDQVKSDVEKYSRATNTPIAIDLSHPEVLDINYEQYPHFRLRIGSRPPAITVWQDTKKNTDSTKKPPKESEILVVAKSQDELLYRVNGEDKIDEADVSEFLLKPLLEFIES
jgi:hypothetical protein